jgi:hypothetical protein
MRETKDLREDKKESVLKEEIFVGEKEEGEKESFIPLEKRRLVTYPIDFTVGSLNEQMGSKNILLDDDFQRRLVWKETQSSKLIESLFLNVPIPVCYFSEIKDGKYSVIDGKQRLGSIEKFFMNNLKLRGLKFFPELNGKKFADLDSDQKRILKSRTIRCIVILKESDPKIRYDTFERLNTNSVSLNKQELRNSIYRGRVNDLLIELAGNKLFQHIRGVDEEDLRMNDRELILRFFSFHERLSLYRSSFATFLDSFLEEGNKFSEEKIKELKKVFLETIEKVNVVFGNKAFRRFDPNKNSWENRINRAIYDVIMLSFDKIVKEDIEKEKDNILKIFKEICGNEDFRNAITTWTKRTEAIQIRLNLWVNNLNTINLKLPEFKVGRDKI